jgi:hypothetical protein
MPAGGPRQAHQATCRHIHQRFVGHQGHSQQAINCTKRCLSSKIVTVRIAFTHQKAERRSQKRPQHTKTLLNHRARQVHTLMDDNFGDILDTIAMVQKSNSKAPGVPAGSSSNWTHKVPLQVCYAEASPPKPVYPSEAVQRELCVSQVPRQQRFAGEI